MAADAKGRGRLWIQGASQQRAISPGTDTQLADGGAARGQQWRRGRAEQQQLLAQRGDVGSGGERLEERECLRRRCAGRRARYGAGRLG